MGIAVLAVLGIGFLLASKQNGSSAASVDPKILQGSSPHMLGATTAKVQIVEFGDYQCPGCGAYEPVLEQLRAKYKDNPNFSFVFRNFPLPQHPNAIPAALAAEAAGLQGKFWEMHDLIYANQSQWAEVADSTPTFQSYAAKIGLDPNKFMQDLKSPQLSEKISADQRDGQSLSVDRTPTIYLNGKTLQSLPTLDQFEKQIDSLIK